MKILEIGDANSIFFYELIKRLKAARPDYEIEILNVSGVYNRYNYDFIDPEKLHCIKVQHGIKTLPFFRSFFLLHSFKNELRKLPSFDFVHVHYVLPYYAGAIQELLSKGKLILTFWGTDLLSSGLLARKLQKILIRHADKITYYSSKLDRAFHSKFGEKYARSARNIIFGTNALEEILAVERKYTAAEMKERLNLPTDKVIVSCGGNGFSTQQHASMIHALEQADPKYLDQIYVLIHMGYGGRKKYKEKIHKLFLQSGLSGRVEFSYFYSEKIAMLRLCVDIYCIMQKVDGLSSALKEHMFAGSVPCIGSWLQYDALERGAYVHWIPAVSALQSEIKAIIDCLPQEKEKCKVNRDLIGRLDSWDESITKWIRLFENKETPDMYWN